MPDRETTRPLWALRVCVCVCACVGVCARVRGCVCVCEIAKKLVKDSGKSPSPWLLMRFRRGSQNLLRRLLLAASLFRQRLTSVKGKRIHTHS